MSAFNQLKDHDQHISFPGLFIKKEKHGQQPMYFFTDKTISPNPFHLWNNEYVAGKVYSSYKSMFHGIDMRVVLQMDAIDTIGIKDKPRGHLVVPHKDLSDHTCMRLFELNFTIQYLAPGGSYYEYYDKLMITRRYTLKDIIDG